MSWTDVSFPYASTLTAAKLNQLQANFAAITSAASGAPSIVTAAIEPGAIRIYHLSEAQASGSVVVAGNGESTYTLTGGTYSWWTMSSTGSGGFSFKSGNQAAGVVGLGNNDFVNSQTFYVDENYIQASPPYNLGNGDIPLFVFLTLNNNGEVADIVVAADPPWAHNGPTSIIPERQSAGRAYRHYVVNGSLVELEITQEIKNKDMSLHPHPFDRTRKGVKVLMLDPFGKLVQRLVDVLQESHARESRNILLKYVKFSAMSSDFITPPGVSAIAGVLK